MKNFARDYLFKKSPKELLSFVELRRSETDAEDGFQIKKNLLGFILITNLAVSTSFEDEDIPEEASAGARKKLIVSALKSLPHESAGIKGIPEEAEISTKMDLLFAYRTLLTLFHGSTVNFLSMGEMYTIKDLHKRLFLSKSTSKITKELRESTQRMRAFMAGLKDSLDLEWNEQRIKDACAEFNRLGLKKQYDGTSPEDRSQLSEVAGFLSEFSEEVEMAALMVLQSSSRLEKKPRNLPEAEMKIKEIEYFSAQGHMAGVISEMPACGLNANEEKVKPFLVKSSLFEQSAIGQVWTYLDVINSISPNALLKVNSRELRKLLKEFAAQEECLSATTDNESDEDSNETDGIESLISKVDAVKKSAEKGKRELFEVNLDASGLIEKVKTMDEKERESTMRDFERNLRDGIKSINKEHGIFDERDPKNKDAVQRAIQETLDKVFLEDATELVIRPFSEPQVTSKKGQNSSGKGEMDFYTVSPEQMKNRVLH